MTQATPFPMRPRQADRVKSIHDAIVANDIERLRQLARSEDGLMFDWLRRQAWPILMHTLESVSDREEGLEQDLRDPVQISKDVERSLYYFPQGLYSRRIPHAEYPHADPIYPAASHRSFPASQDHTETRAPRNDCRNSLAQPTASLLPGLPRCLYHFLACSGQASGYPGRGECRSALFERFCVTTLHTDGMLDSIDPVSRQLSLVTTLLRSENPRLHEFLMSANIMPYYTLSWVLTWFSHDFTDFEKVMRLFDLFMASTPLMPVYVACAIVLSHSQDLLHQEIEMVHMCLVNLPQDPDMDIDVVIAMALELEKKYPPLELQKSSGIWLDQCSPVNTYENEWHCLSADEQPDQIAAERYLSMVRQTEPCKPEPRKRRPSLWERLSGGSLVVG
ncbi:rab-GTPase-TBC domain-containing protein [Endogone sp. FLAS-F59071]|nr:rab-GTPase-TBC domain-containing protein [Endogone sp. FLAS-F59071]|eukprot:RUS16468.1 rab-GTPase-TBC domain-containing protein [Endogone sp. FLAS-F59071]